MYVSNMYIYNIAFVLLGDFMYTYMHTLKMSEKMEGLPILYGCGLVGQTFVIPSNKTNYKSILLFPFIKNEKDKLHVQTF